MNHGSGEYARDEDGDGVALGAVQVVRLAAAAVRGGGAEVERLRRAGVVDGELCDVALRATAS